MPGIPPCCCTPIEKCDECHIVPKVLFRRDSYSGRILRYAYVSSSHQKNPGDPIDTVLHYYECLSSYVFSGEGAVTLVFSCGDSVAVCDPAGVSPPDATHGAMYFGFVDRCEEGADAAGATNIIKGTGAVPTRPSRFAPWPDGVPTDSSATSTYTATRITYSYTDPFDCTIEAFLDSDGDVSTLDINGFSLVSDAVEWETDVLTYGGGTPDDCMYADDESPLPEWWWPIPKDSSHMTPAPVAPCVVHFVERTGCEGSPSPTTDYGYTLQEPFEGVFSLDDIASCETWVEISYAIAADYVTGTEATGCDDAELCPGAAPDPPFCITTYNPITEVFRNWYWETGYTATTPEVGQWWENPFAACLQITAIVHVDDNFGCEQDAAPAPAFDDASFTGPFVDSTCTP